jgi:hypothetical protein
MDTRGLTARPAVFEFATYMRANPGLLNTKAGNELLINLLEQEQQRALDYRGLALSSNSYKDYADKKTAFDADPAHAMVNPLTGKPFFDGRLIDNSTSYNKSKPQQPVATPSGQLPPEPGLADLPNLPHPKSPAEADKLAPNTWFVLPDGRIGHTAGSASPAPVTPAPTPAPVAPMPRGTPGIGPAVGFE